MMLSIYLFGPPRFEQDGTPIHIGRRKGIALVSYLTRKNQPSSREKLATLFWPEHDQTEALKGLRRELARVKKELGKENITATQSQLALTADARAKVDVSRFKRHVQLVRDHDHFPKMQCLSCLDALTNAVKLYGDDFMAGFNLPDCPEFDTWQDFQRESLRQSLAQALYKLTIWHATQCQYARAINHARRRLGLNPLNEEARRTVMKVYAEAGQSAEALQVYEEGVQLLQDELGIAPAKESRQLCQAIRSGQVAGIGEGVVARGKTLGLVGPAPYRRLHSNLPQQITPFVGRSRELTMIQLRLQEPGCRLLTLVGPGGIGKTRLALEVGRCTFDEGTLLFTDGVFFVPLGAVNETGGIVSAILAAADINLYGSMPPEQQLLDYLRDKKMLFILDNLEHLPGSGEKITAILTAATGVKILATSRVALRLQEEWFHPLGGLSVPPTGSLDQIYMAPGDEVISLRAYDAVRLFEQRARHASPTFSLGEEAEQVVHICRLVEGMPLALELAATWLKVLETREVADELEQSLDLLDSRFDNIPERHQSIRVIFNQTWAMLDPAEQRALGRLSVFRGGFTRDAAMHIAGANLFLLSALVDKALLYTTTRGRYRLHELMRQFAAEQSAEMGLVERSRAAHCRYYMATLKQRESELKGARQMEARNHIKDHLEDIRLAWNWALHQDDLEALSQALESIYLYFFVCGRNQEGVDFLRPAYFRLAPRNAGTPKAVWGRIVSRMSLMKSFLSPKADLEAEIQTGLAVAQKVQDQAEIAFCHFVQGIFNTLIRDDTAVAIKAYQEARQTYRSLKESFYLVQVLIWLGFSYGNSSHLDQFFALNSEALDLAREAGHHASAANALGNLVGGAFCVGDYVTAEKYAHEVGAIGATMELPNMITHSKTQLCLANFLKGNIDLARELAHEAHALALEINHPLSIAYTLTFLGLLASVGCDYPAGKRLGEESLAIPAPRFEVIMAHWAVAIASCGMGQNDAAWQHVVAMLELARSAGFVGMITWPLPVMSIVRASAGQEENAVELLALAQTHPLSPTGWQEEWPLLVDLRSRLEAELGAETFAATWERGLALDLNTVIATALDSQDAAP